jgi:hypothetical protein
MSRILCVLEASYYHSILLDYDEHELLFFLFVYRRTIISVDGPIADDMAHNILIVDHIHLCSINHKTDRKRIYRSNPFRLLDYSSCGSFI